MKILTLNVHVVANMSDSSLCEYTTGIYYFPYTVIQVNGYSEKNPLYNFITAIHRNCSLIFHTSHTIVLWEKLNGRVNKDLNFSANVSNGLLLWGFLMLFEALKR